jgi:alpha-D-ribose 1-methylphosphonate 5-triphosphate synthase subunit PhnH
MNPQDLSAIGAGFTQEAYGSQQVFRAALQALSHPGRLVDVTHDAQVPQVGHAASAALLLALLDADCCLWLSPALRDSDAAAWLRFHTGCQLVATPAQAQFAWVAAGDDLPALEAFAGGSENYPDQSTTCVIDVVSISADGADPWRLSGPGIQGESTLQAQGLPPDFIAQWAANHAAFPRGVDLFLATPQQIVGLPRSTRIEHTVEA